MDLEFRQQGVGETTYLVLDMDDNFDIDLFAMQMMAHNRFTNIIQTQIVQINERKQIQFNVTGFVKLNNRISGPRSKKEILGILNSILNAFEEVDDYMLDMDHLLLDWEHVYIDGQQNCMLMYLPFGHTSDKDKIVFLQEIVSKIQPDYQERDPYLFDILNAFSRGAIQRLADFREIIKKSAGVQMNENKEEVRSSHSDNNAQAIDQKPHEREEKSSSEVMKKTEKRTSSDSKIPVINIPGREPGKKEIPPVPVKVVEKKKKGLFRIPKAEHIEIPKSENQDSGMQNSSSPNSSAYVDRKQDNMYESYEHTVIMQETGVKPEESEGTIILDQPNCSMSASARLIRKQNGTVYRIDREKILVGSGASANICIFDNKAISRSHAVITFADRDYYMEDNHSRNGSFVNGKRLQPGVKETIYDGMTLRFANEEFEFKKT
jgi:hypothetical protein